MTRLPQAQKNKNKINMRLAVVDLNAKERYRYI